MIILVGRISLGILPTCNLTPSETNSYVEIQIAAIPGGPNSFGKRNNTLQERPSLPVKQPKETVAWMLHYLCKETSSQRVVPKPAPAGVRLVAKYCTEAYIDAVIPLVKQQACGTSSLIGNYGIRHRVFH